MCIIHLLRFSNTKHTQADSFYSFPRFYAVMVTGCLDPQDLLMFTFWENVGLLSSHLWINQVDNWKTDSHDALWSCTVPLLYPSLLCPDRLSLPLGSEHPHTRCDICPHSSQTSSQSVNSFPSSCLLRQMLSLYVMPLLTCFCLAVMKLQQLRPPYLWLTIHFSICS